MNETELIYLLWAVVALEILVIIWLIKWLGKNDILVQISKWQAGVMIQSSKRCRLLEKDKEEYLAGMWDLFGRNKILLHPSWRNYLYSAETTRVIGVSRKLKILEDRQGYISYWKLPTNPPPEYVNSESILNFAYEAIKTAYERFKYTPSEWEIKRDIIIKGGILVLALACLIFFPKIHDVIAQEGRNMYGQAISKLEGILGQFVPKG